MMKSPTSVRTLENLGRVRLSKSFFMRDFLYSEIAQIEGLLNVPDFPDKAILAGSQLCTQVLEPIQEQFGRISIRSGYRSPKVNAVGASNSNQYNCASNKANFGHHIWDYEDQHGYIGATACIVVNSFIDYYEETNDWQALAWWIHDHVPGYSSMVFFPKLAAFNIRWCEQPEKVIKSHVNPKGILTSSTMDNHSTSNQTKYKNLINYLR